MSFLLEQSMVTAIYNKCKNGREMCDYQCGEKFKNDRFLEPKMNVCKANCDVIWDTEFLKQLNEFVKQPKLDSETVLNTRRRIDTAKNKLLASRRKLYKAKVTLKRVLYGRRADMSMRPVQNGPAFSMGQ